MAIATPNTPPSAGWSDSLRVSRSTAMPKATSREARMPTLSPPALLAMTNTTAGSAEKMMPLVPPACSSADFRFGWSAVCMSVAASWGLVVCMVISSSEWSWGQMFVTK